MNKKTQELVISNKEYELHIPLKKGINHAYTEILKVCSNNNNN